MPKSLIILFGLLFSMTIAPGQNNKLRPLTELINTKEPAWTDFLQQWIKDAKNHVEVLPKDKDKADSSLYKSQVTTRSPMGAIVYETGGILIDHGWIRILGSGSKKLDRNLMDWNKGKTYTKLGQQLPYLLIADDVLGGLFAINAGGLDTLGIGKIFYFAPDDLLWTPTDLTYTQFLNFCFSGDIKKFYENLYWNGWEKDISSIDGNQGISCIPFLWTAEGKDINKVSRKPVPIQELWLLHNDLSKQLEKAGK
jgi:hypothetical protein